jgi:hypothetical protein
MLPILIPAGNTETYVDIASQRMISSVKCKKMFDAPRLPRNAKEQLRLAVVQRVERAGSPAFVAAGTGINWRQVYRWIEVFHYGAKKPSRAKPDPQPSSSA